MTGLQEAFYIIGIVFMGLMLVILLGVLAAVIVIRKKIVSLHDTIHEKIDKVMNVKSAGEHALETLTRVVKRSK